MLYLSVNIDLVTRNIHSLLKTASLLIATRPSPPTYILCNSIIIYKINIFNQNCLPPEVTAFQYKESAVIFWITALSQIISL